MCVLSTLSGGYTLSVDHMICNLIGRLILRAVEQKWVCHHTRPFLAHPVTSVPENGRARLGQLRQTKLQHALRTKIILWIAKASHYKTNSPYLLTGEGGGGGGGGGTMPSKKSWGEP